MTGSPPRLPPLELCYKPDAARAQERYRAFWEGHIIDRPPINIKAPKDGAVQPRLPQILAYDFDYDAAVARFEEWASATFFGGEAMPYLWITWGPSTMAAFCGAELVMSPDTDTSWVEPFVTDLSEVEFKIPEDNFWWQSTIQFCRIAREKGQGKFLVGHLDLHSSVDLLSSIRGAENLCIDIIEHPDVVERAARAADTLYKPIYDAVYELAGMKERGSITWLELWSDGRTHVPSCDFAYMISTEHFRRFVLPSIEYEVSCLDHAVYHLDGVGQIPHLDDLLAIPRLHGIQWVPGAGQPGMPAWIDLLKRIQSAGKSVHIGVYPDELKVVHPELDPEKVYYQVWGCQSESEARKLIDWLEANT